MLRIGRPAVRHPSAADGRPRTSSPSTAQSRTSTRSAPRAATSPTTTATTSSASSASRSSPCADGTIFSVGWNKIGGNRLWLVDAQGNQFYYAHLSAFSTTAVNGAHVKAGEVIGFMGNTGDAEGTPVHLHFEVHPVSLLYLGYDGAVDPTPYLDAWRHQQDLPFPIAGGWAPAVPGGSGARARRDPARTCPTSRPRTGSTRRRFSRRSPPRRPHAAAARSDRGRADALEPRLRGPGLDAAVRARREVARRTRRLRRRACP